MKAILGGIIAGLVVVIVWRGQEADGLRARVDSLQRQSRRIDTVRQRDSVRVTRTVTTTQTLRDTLLQRVTDTVAVKEYIYQTDTLRTACLACVASAAQLSVVNDSLQRAYTGLVRALDAQTPKRWQKYLPVATGVAGFLLGAKLRP